jgi:hypothetical protein
VQGFRDFKDAQPLRHGKGVAVPGLENARGRSQDESDAPARPARAPAESHASGGEHQDLQQDDVAEISGRQDGS